MLHVFRTPAGVLLSVWLAMFCFSDQVAGADDPVFSGPQPGEKVVGFEVMAVYGEQAGKTFDPIEKSSGKPTLLVFVHKLTRPGVGLTRGLTAYARSLADKDVVSGIIWLSDDKAKAEAYLNRAKKSLNFSVPVGVSVDGDEGPGAYGLNRNVELTILVAEDNKVTANFALVQPSIQDGERIAAELAKLVEAEPPSTEQIESFAYPGRSDAMKRRMRRRGAGRRAAEPQNTDAPGKDARSRDLP
jgi:hypothetical protein